MESTTDHRGRKVSDGSDYDVRRAQLPEDIDWAVNDEHRKVLLSSEGGDQTFTPSADAAQKLQAAGYGLCVLSLPDVGGSALGSLTSPVDKMIYLQADMAAEAQERCLLVALAQVQ